MTWIRLAAVGVMWLCTTAALAQGGAFFGNTRGGSDVFYGGTISVSLGAVDYYAFAPMVGMHLGPQVSVGGTLIYRYRKDDRYAQTLTTDDYGASIFGRYRVTPIIFAQAEYEYLDYEFIRTNVSTGRDTADSIFVGGGVSSPLSGNASMYATGLYNVLHDDDSPYDSPWSIRFGVSVGF
ncbi:MAG: hypothetical protein FD165_1883 [Gammaproteobacteria bacterium]|nr:MAG: hypothetical protein FD165_1883 [Gammaproteobacteria bacterium]TND04456.1 MAG: hypothetical protein FD120_1570 [Gammaproteobacteria bacterium]